MLERVDQSDKKRFQVMMSGAYIDKLRHLSSDRDMTQGKFIEHLLDNVIKLWERERLRDIYVLIDRATAYLHNNDEELPLIASELYAELEWAAMDISAILGEDIVTIRDQVDYGKLRERVFGLFKEHRRLDV